MSSIFEEYQALKKEVDRLRDTNKRMSTNIDAWVANFQNPELPVSGDIEQEGLVQVKSEVVEDQTSEILSKAEFKKPIGKVRNIRDIDLDDEYAAWGWEQA